MPQNPDYISTNKVTWNAKVDVHVASDFYNHEAFLNGETSLNEIELALLGDISGKSVLHLQCHFGQDTISLERLGAKVTGVDFSEKAIEVAKNTASKTNSSAQFICCDIYDLPNHLNEQFDIVYTSYGTIGWLPDINKWAGIVSKFLKPNGKFVFAEFHPVVWMFDDNFEQIIYRYFNDEAILETESGTYADRDSNMELKSITWNHGLGEVVNSLIQNGLSVNSLKEYDYSPYNCFSKTVEVAPKKYRIEHLDNKIPMVYSIVATKK